MDISEISTILNYIVSVQKQIGYFVTINSNKSETHISAKTCNIYFGSDYDRYLRRKRDELDVTDNLERESCLISQNSDREKQSRAVFPHLTEN